MADLRCELCDRDFRTASGKASHDRSKHPPQADGLVLEATDRAIAAASYLSDLDAGAVEVLRDLARTIDGMGMRDPDAPMDNVTVPTYLKYAAELGLTPLSRQKLDLKEQRGGSKLAELRSIRGGRAAG